MRYLLEDIGHAGIGVLPLAGGRAWAAVPTGHSISSFGTFGTPEQQYAWTTGSGVSLLDLEKSKVIGTAKLAFGPDHILTGRNAEQLYALTHDKTGKLSVAVVETKTAKVSATHVVPEFRYDPYRNAGVALADGCIRFPAHTEDRIGIITLDPASGHYDFARVPATAHHPHFRHLWISPSGRYALAPDHASLPMHIDQGNTWFGATLQLWEVGNLSELIYRRTLVCAWFSEREMTSHRFGLFDPLPYSTTSDIVRAPGKIGPELEAVMKAMAQQPPGKLLPPAIPQKRDPNLNQKDPKEAHLRFADMLDRIVWQPDENAFWVTDLYGVGGPAEVGGYACVGLDGSISSRISFPDLAATTKPVAIEAQDGRRMRMIYRLGEAERIKPPTFADVTIDGAASERPWLLTSVPLDDFEPLVEAPSTDRARELVEAQLEELFKLNVPLSGRSAHACADAMKWIENKLGDGLDERFQSQLTLVFHLKTADQSLGVTQFFELVEHHGAEMIPGLSRLVQKFLSHEWLTSWLENGICLGPAVKALCVIDPDALAIIKPYPLAGDYVEAKVLPVIAAHGWTDALIEHVLDSYFYCYRGSARAVWRKHGLGAAAAERYTPSEFAALLKRVYQIPDLAAVSGTKIARFAKAIGITVDTSQFADDFKELAEEIAPFTAWERKMFSMLGVKKL